VGVRVDGSFQAATQKGQASALVPLLPLKADKTLVGLGVLSSLRGEVTLFGGQAFLSVPSQDGGFSTEELGAHQDSAAFMVQASVSDWQTVALPQNTGLDELPSAFEKLAEAAGLDVEQPIPFMIEGSVGNLTLSVVNGSAFVGDREIPEEAMKAAARKVTRATCQGTGVGFFGKSDHPEFLANDTHVHLHFVEQTGALAGHVEHIDLPSGTSFRLPIARSR
jgi:acetolactate decarboxylase